MTVIMVLLTFAIFLMIDYIRGHKHVSKQPAPRIAARTVAPRIPALVAGFEVPENLRYHAGHTWALGESSEMVRIGMDDFASKLVGKIESISLPQRGRWVRQGQKIWTILRDGKSVDMVSPIEGTVTDVNDAVARNPELARRDPYGDGWLVTVQAPDAKINFRNLLEWDARPSLDRVRGPAASQPDAGTGRRAGPGWRRRRRRPHRAHAGRRLGGHHQGILPLLN